MDLDLTKISNNIQLVDNIWISKGSKKVSYPVQGSQTYYQIEDNSFWFRHRNKCLIKLVHKHSKDNFFFDIGGGNGYVAHGLQMSGINTVLIEPSFVAINNAKQRGVKNLVCSTLESSSFKKNSIPAIGIFDVIEHIEDDNLFLEQLYNYLKIDGKLFITAPTYNFLWSNEDTLAGHYRRYTINKLKNQLKSHGFKIDYSSYIFSPLVLPVFLFRSIPSFLRIKTKMDEIKKYKMQHGNNNGISTKIIQYFLDQEYKKISQGLSLTFGSSCLIIATKK